MKRERALFDLEACRSLRHTLAMIPGGSTPIVRTLAKPSTQSALLEVRPIFTIEKNAQARNAYGEAAAQIACAALRLDSIPIDGSKAICFDAQDPRDGRYFEIKSVKRVGGKVVAYDWRMKKEAGAGVPCSYAILCHAVRSHRDGATLFDAFAAGGLELLVVSLETVHRIAAAQPKQRIKKERIAAAPETGYNRKGYKEGYRNVPVRDLRDRCMHAETAVFRLYDVPFSVRVFREL